MTNTSLALWIPRDSDSAIVPFVKQIEWARIWDGSSLVSAGGLPSGGERTVLVIKDPAKDPPAGSDSQLLRVYDCAPTADESWRGRRLLDGLRWTVERFAGLVVVPCESEEAREDIEFILEVAPDVEVFAVQEAETRSIPRLRTFPTLVDLIDAVSNAADTDASIGSFRLKGAPIVALRRPTLERVSKSWRLLLAADLVPRAIDQESFDDFLNGDESWNAIAAGIAYPREVEVAETATEGLSEGADQPTTSLEAAVFAELNAIEQDGLPPDTLLRQLYLFAEGGAGSTTIIRRTAVQVASAGYPVAVTRPGASSLESGVLEGFITEVQDKWLERRSGRGSGRGLLPVVLFVDTDGETSFREAKLGRTLGRLGRRVLVVRAFLRSADELARIGGDRVFVLRATVSEELVLGIGKNLADVAKRNNLHRVPGPDEWRAFHEGMTSFARYVSPRDTGNARGGSQQLFLIGIYPFMRERVADENSLEQYYYRIWRSIESESVREFIKVLSAFGTYGVSVPYWTIRRTHSLDSLAASDLDKSASRALGSFVAWERATHDTSTWSVNVRHPLVGALLSRAIAPDEGKYPFSSLLDTLLALTHKNEDRWVAEKLAFAVGRSFKSSAARFSLDYDTTPQRAARAIYGAIPRTLKAESPTIQHHEARYYVHVLRACRAALEDPTLTLMADEEVANYAQATYERTEDLLKKALAANDGSESLSNILNTRANHSFEFAEVRRGLGDLERYRETSIDGLSYQRDALRKDPANYVALYQMVLRLTLLLEDESWPPEAQARHYVEALLHFEQLRTLTESRSWRSQEEELTLERQIGAVHGRLKDVAERLDAKGLPTLPGLSDETRLVLQMQQEVGSVSLDRAARDSVKVDRLRCYRSELLKIDSLSSFGLQYAYRFFLADPVDRFEFGLRLEVIRRMKVADIDLYNTYRHDEAAMLCCQLRIDLGEEKFRALRAFRKSAAHSPWVWMNERLLVVRQDVKPQLYVATLQVVDPLHGWADVTGVDVRVRYQPYHFVDRGLQKNSVFKAALRFTLNGLMAIPISIGEADLRGVELGG